MNREKILLSGLFLILVWALGASAYAETDSAGSVKNKIQQERQTLQKLKDEIRHKKRQAEQAETKRESVLQSLQQFDDKLMTSRQLRYSVNRKLKRKDQELQEINAQLSVVQARIRQRDASIQARLRRQYIEGRFGYLRALLSVDSAANLHRRFSYLSAISKQEYTLLQAHRDDLERLTEIKGKRAEARDHMLGLKQHTEAQLSKIRRLKQKKRVLLAKITREKEAYDQAAAELERSAARVDSLLRELESRRKASIPSGSRNLAGIRGIKGTLPWPAQGKVVSFFGRQKHPTFKTYIERKGIEIRTVEGSEILAVMPGTVSYADWLKGFGLVLILDHGNGFFSLYAHASKLLTKVGKKVQAGQVIGETGDTGLTADPTLYFELRNGAAPVDPLLWLAKRP